MSSDSRKDWIEVDPEYLLGELVRCGYCSTWRHLSQVPGHFDSIHRQLLGGPLKDQLDNLHGKLAKVNAQLKELASEKGRLTAQCAPIINQLREMGIEFDWETMANPVVAET